MKSPRLARARERLVAMLAIGFCLGALATTYLAWRRDALDAVRGGAASAPPAMVAGPTLADVAEPFKSEVVATAPSIGPTSTPPDAPRRRR